MPRLVLVDDHGHELAKWNVDWRLRRRKDVAALIDEIDERVTGLYITREAQDCGRSATPAVSG